MQPPPLPQEKHTHREDGPQLLQCLATQLEHLPLLPRLHEHLRSRLKNRYAAVAASRRSRAKCVHMQLSPACQARLESTLLTCCIPAKVMLLYVVARAEAEQPPGQGCTHLRGSSQGHRHGTSLHAICSAGGTAGITYNTGRHLRLNAATGCLRHIRGGWAGCLDVEIGPWRALQAAEPMQASGHGAGWPTWRHTCCKVCSMSTTLNLHRLSNTCTAPGPERGDGRQHPGRIHGLEPQAAAV